MSQAATPIEEQFPANQTPAQPTRHIDALRPLPDNPREDISEDDPTIIDMARSIIKNDIIEPLVVNPDNFLYAGHRRRVASRVAYKITGNEKFLHVPVTINHTPLKDALELALHENMQRKSLTLVEEARAMKSIMDRNNFILADLARELAVPTNEISPRLAILKCEPEVQKLFALDQLPLNAATWLVQCDIPAQQINYAGLLARRQITMKKLQEELRDASYKERHKKQPLPRSETQESNSSPVSQSVPRRRKKQIHSHQPPSALPTREDAMASLMSTMSKGKRSITLFNFKQVVESICCACGMVGNSEVCRSCPFARIILGVSGRAD